MATLTRGQQIEKSYDYISAIFTKQGRVMPFDLCYGDGSIHGQLTKGDVLTIWRTIVDFLTDKIG
jgi:hypothetical protein